MRRAAPVIIGLVLLVGCGRGQTVDGAAPPAASGPDTPVGVDVPPADPPTEPRPTRVEVVAGAVDLRPQPFESAAPVGERQLAVRFWGGVAPCSVVGRVDVHETPERITVTVQGGRAPTPEPVVCMELAVFQELIVDLAAPVGDRTIVDGAA